MNIKIWDLDENLEEIANKDVFLDEVILGEEIDCTRKIDTSNLLGYCEEIMIHDLRDDKSYSEKHEDKYAVSFSIGFNPVKNIINENFYNAAWDIFRKRIHLLLRVFNLTSWRIGKGILSRRGEDILIVELDGLDYPQWDINFSLTRSMTYRDVFKIAKSLEAYIQEFKIEVDNDLLDKKLKKGKLS